MGKDKKQKKSEKRNQSATLKNAGAFRGHRNATSMFFLLWSLFTALSLLIILLTGISQGILAHQSYEEEAAKEVGRTGRALQAEILKGTPEEYNNNYNFFLRRLGEKYDVRLYILSEEGKKIFPQEHNVEADNPNFQEYFDYSEELEVLKSHLSKTSENYVVFEGVDCYVYGSELSIYGGQGYLYVEKSIDLVPLATENMEIRMVLISIFILLLAFAMSSAVSGWISKPIIEITEKAHHLAQGDFNVDFHGSNYSKEMVDLAETLNFAKDELSKTDKMQKELIANVSHDFKTPLTMIKAYASMIMEISGDIPEKRNKHAQVIVDEADRLASLVGDLLDLSKLQSGIEHLQRSVLNMSEYVYEVLDRFAYLKETQGYTFVVDVDEELYTNADRIKVGQVLYNLIGNAVNYTGEDKTVYVELKKQAQDTFVFLVKDTGKGIKPEELDDIWDRYYRSSETHKRPVKGMGLGLSIVKSILQRHELIFGVNSEVGKGSAFYVVFPVATENQEQNTPSNA